MTFVGREKAWLLSSLPEREAPGAGRGSEGMVPLVVDIRMTVESHQSGCRSSVVLRTDSAALPAGQRDRLPNVATEQ
jgi:hypothetical protein